MTPAHYDVERCFIYQNVLLFIKSKANVWSLVHGVYEDIPVILLLCVVVIGQHKSNNDSLFH